MQNLSGYVLCWLVIGMVSGRVIAKPSGKTGPDLTDYHLLHGDTSAAREAAQGVSKDRNSPQRLYKTARILQFRGFFDAQSTDSDESEIPDLSEALDLYERIITENPAFIPAYNPLFTYYINQEDPASLLRISFGFLKSNSGSESARKSLLQVSRLLINQGRLSDADKIISAVNDVLPEYGPGIAARGVLYANDGQFEKAENFLVQARLAAPGDLQIISDLLSTLLVREKYREARLLIRDWQKLAPQDPFPYFYLGCLDFMANDPNYRSNLTLFLNKSRNQENLMYPAVAAFLFHWQRPDHHSGSWRPEEVMSSLRLSDTSFADTVFITRVLLHAEEDNEAFLTIRAQSFSALRLHEQAIATLGHLRRIRSWHRNPATEDLDFALGYEYYQLSRFSDALVSFRQLKDARNRIDVLYYEAECERELGNTDAARTIHEKVASQDDENFFRFIESSKEKLEELSRDST